MPVVRHRRNAFPRSDSLDAATSNTGASSSAGRPLSGYSGNPQAYAPWRRDSDSNSSIQSGSGVGTAGGLPVNATSHSSTTNVIIHKDSNVTAYVEKKFPVSSKGHVIIVLNLHVPGIYTLTPNDLPLLNHIHATATRLLYSLNPPPVPSSPTPGSRSNAEEALANRVPLAPSPEMQDPAVHIGFITPPFKDSKIPITDHLHCHAYIGTPDLAGWWRAVAYSGLAWYPIQDLIAEIRESVSNNRVKSGYINRPTAPIDLVPSAGAMSGGADGRAEQYLPLPLQANKLHMSPQPTSNSMNTGSATSLLGDGGTSSGVQYRGTIPALTISTTGVETFDQGLESSTNSSAALMAAGGGGSVDLSSFRRTSNGDDEFGYEPDPATATRSTFGLDDQMQRQNSVGSGGGGGHRPRESFDEAAWEGMDGNTGAFEGEEGQAGPGPSTIRALSNAAS